jgi:predicted Zn-dependent protease
MRRLLVALGLAVWAFFIIIFIQGDIAKGSWSDELVLPTIQIHPLPPTLSQWQDRTGSGDYFLAVKPSKVGYLVWSEFPIKVYVERPPLPRWIPANSRRFQQWVDAILPAVHEWSAYLPLAVVDRSQEADITIWRSRPTLQITRQGSRAQAAEVRYEIYAKPSSDRRGAILSQKYTILISPDLSAPYIEAAARHELGHALGIWGHSPMPTDALYLSQVSNPPAISSRDINTLKRIYQQPTRLGWPIALGNR